MKSINEVRILGNVTADPETKMTPSGTKVSTFAVATNRRWKDSEGNEKEEAEFSGVVAWGYLAEIAEKEEAEFSGVVAWGYLAEIAEKHIRK
jgi:single-strand DNA-binding protein